MRDAPVRLIDPDGEGVYMLAGDQRWSLRHIALEFFGDAREWRNLDYTGTWMREDDEGNWHPIRGRWWHGLLPSRWAPVLYAYLTPKPEPATAENHSERPDKAPIDRKDVATSPPRRSEP